MKNISARESARRIEASRRRNDKHTPKFADGKPFDTFVEDVVEEIQTDGEGAVLLAKLQCFIAKKLVEAGVTEDNMPTRQRDVLEKAVGSTVMDIWGDVWPGGAGLEDLAGIRVKTRSVNTTVAKTLDNDDSDDDDYEDDSDEECDLADAANPAHRQYFVQTMQALTNTFSELKGTPPYSFTKRALLDRIDDLWPDRTTEMHSTVEELNTFLRATHMDATTGDGLPGWRLVWVGDKVTFCNGPATLPREQKGVRGKSGKGKKK